MDANFPLICPHCGTVNRVAADRPAAAARCGSCKGALFTGHPLAVDEAQLRRHIETDGLPLLVDVWAEWCGPCRAMAPAFAHAAHALEPEFRLLKLDADQAPGFLAEFAIRSIPTL
ncbi:MAG: thioredoxin domain-containing protein, partial [Acetobacteraceae bacterium]